MGVGSLVLIALLLVLLGVGAVTGRLPGPLRRFGRLPGDLRVERPGFRLYVPITSALLAGLALSLLLGGLQRLGPLLGRALGWFGRLPGDVRLQGDGWFVFLPFGSMLVTSLLLTAIASLIGWWRRGR